MLGEKSEEPEVKGEEKTGEKGAEKKRELEGIGRA